MADTPLAYPFCCQTVTIYRKTDHGILRQVTDRAWLQWEHKYQEDSMGSLWSGSFTLILPSGGVSVRPGDRITEGTGPELSEWKALKSTPELLFGQVVGVTDLHWNKTFCHQEAEGETI